MATTTAPRPAASAQDALIGLLARYWSYLFLLLMIVFFSVTGQNFFSVRNFSSVLVTATLVTLLAVGQTLVIITGGIDLSIGWTAGLASVVCARVMKSVGADPNQLLPALVLGVIAGLAVSLIPGLINGTLIARVKVPPFIATLGMFGIVRGVAFLLTDGQQVVGNIPTNVRDTLSSIGNGSLLWNIPERGLVWFSRPPDITPIQLRGAEQLLPYPVLITLLVILIFGFILGRTVFGRHTYAIGGSMESSRRAGINVKNHLVKIYLISAFCAGIAGVLHVFRYTAGSPLAGEARLLDSVAAVVIGGTSLFGGAGRISGSVVGALIIGVLQTGLVILNIDSLWQFVIVGIVIIVAVLVNQAQTLLERRRSNA